MAEMVGNWVSSFYTGLDKFIDNCEFVGPHFFYNNRTKPEKKLDLKGLETCIKWINESLRNEEDEQQNFVWEDKKCNYNYNH